MQERLVKSVNRKGMLPLVVFSGEVVYLDH